MHFGPKVLPLVMAALLPSCAQMYLPQFDGGVLNPDIRVLRAGEIMEGVKCAMVAFMHERELKLLDQRIKNDEHRISSIEVGQDWKRYRPYELNYPEKAPAYPQCGLNTHYMKDFPGPKCVPNNCDLPLVDRGIDQRLGVSVWDHKSKKGGTEPTGCVAVPDYSRFALDPTQSAQIQLQLTALNTGGMNYTRLDATRLPLYPEIIVPGSGPLGIPFPMFNWSAKGTTIFDLNAVMPQSIHTYQQVAGSQSFAVGERYERKAKRKFALAAEPAVGEARKRIETAIQRASGYSEEQAPGLDELVGQLKTALDRQSPRQPLDPETQKAIDDLDALIKPLEAYDKTVTAEYQKERKSIERSVGPRLGRLLAHPYPPFDARLKQDLEQGKVALSAIAAHYKSFDLRKEKETDLDDWTKLVKDILEDRKQTNEFQSACRVDSWTYTVDDTRRIDFLALKRLLNNVVDEQDKAMHRGIPDVSLDKLNLTSSFQLVMETSAATVHIFRFFPVLVPPTGSLKADHTHQLKITLNGRKQKADKGNSKKLIESCRQRLAANSAAEESETESFCESAQGQMLESIVQGLDKASTSTTQ